jgi:hypothetical protein
VLVRSLNALHGWETANADVLDMEALEIGTKQSNT